MLERAFLLLCAVRASPSGVASIPKSVVLIRDLHAQLTASLAGADDAGLPAAGSWFVERTGAVEAGLYQVRESCHG